MLRNILFFLFITLIGCSSTDPLDLPPPKEIRNFGDTFRVSPRNKYAFVIKGQTFQFNGDRLSFSKADDLCVGDRLVDSYIDNDIDQISRLALCKGYDVYLAEMDKHSVSELRNYLNMVANVSNDATQVLIAYSGEGDKNGWKTRGCIARGNYFTMDVCRIKPEALIWNLADINGSKAVLINACESGCMVEAAQKNPNFKGVIIAACPVGYSTTPHEPSNLSAVYASFLKLYEDDPRQIRNLMNIEISRTGSWFNNLRHKISDIGAGGLPVSYEPVIFANANFLF